MDINNLALDISDALKKTYFIIRARPYADVKVRLTTQQDPSGKTSGELMAVTIINSGFGEMDVERVWFLTTYNRPVFSEFLDSKMPVKLLEHDRVTYHVPVAELKAALNKKAGDSFAQVVLADGNGYQYAGRIGQAEQKQLT